ncbi:uncharacterized protein K02A2.6-like, partial [Pseudonaja textilis]|uniref:uncharacterized protein K02A2.6-like n=1 Tax=Pseudonaja textilis TaxID=8673 RepID=UPI000EAA08D0
MRRRRSTNCRWNETSRNGEAVSRGSSAPGVGAIILTQSANSLMPYFGTVTNGDTSPRCARIGGTTAPGDEMAAPGDETAAPGDETAPPPGPETDTLRASGARTGETSSSVSPGTKKRPIRQSSSGTQLPSTPRKCMWRTLSKPERNYSQLDKEALAVITGVKRFHEYLYGRTFSIITNHKLLLGILAGNKATPNVLSPRMTRWSEFLATYSYQLTHRPGKNITHADALSCSPLPDLEDDPALTTSTLHIETLLNPPMTTSDIARETNKDKCLARVLNWVEKGWPETDGGEQFKTFQNRQTELFTQKGCILWGDRVVIPETLQKRKIRVKVTIENKPCIMEVDSGSSLSMVSWKTLKQLIPNIRRQDLSSQRLILKDYQGNRIPVAGTRHFQVSFKGHNAILPLTIVDRDRPSLLGLQWFAPLGIRMAGIHHTEDDDWEAALVHDFREVFNESLGKYKGSPISFNLRPDIAPIRLKPHRVPFALKSKIDEQLDKLIAQGVLEPIDHARWETPIVTPIKPDGSIRICGDYKATLNHALQQSAYPVPVVQHLLHSLGGGKIFTKLDLAQAYQQLPVDPETAEAQTIVTHRGAFKCNRLQFGVSVAPGIFQSLMERLLQGIKGVMPYFDDVLIAAPTKSQLEKRLRTVLQRFKDAGLRVKKEKCQLCTERVEFLGYLLDKQGIHPTEKKLAAIKNAPRPKNKTDLQAFLGLINFYNIFLPQKATVAEPLHRLLDKRASWIWGRQEEHAFQQVKDLLTSKAVLIQYNETLPLTVTCDASPFGVGATLSHVLPNGSEAPIAFFSRTLSKIERNYSHLDKEALAIVSAIKRFHEYVYGRPFSIITDHNPLLGILAGDKPTPHILSPRMTRWSEFLTAYDYQLKYCPGKSIPHADALSRSPLPEPQENPAPTLPVLQIETMPSPPLTAQDIAFETKRDSCLARVLGWVERGWPDYDPKEIFKPFKNRQTELFSQRGCILWGDRVVVPTKLQKRILQMLHNGHPGIVHMWPGMDKQIETWVTSCNRCQENHSAPPKAPPAEWETPRGPWSRIHIDFAGPTRGHTFLITIDAYSNWLEVNKMKATTTEAVIKKLNRLFATHGLPDVLVSDNGPQFTALAFEQYLAERGIRHAITSPAHPAANGRAE